MAMVNGTATTPCTRCPNIRASHPRLSCASPGCCSSPREPEPKATPGQVREPQSSPVRTTAKLRWEPQSRRQFVETALWGRQEWGRRRWVDGKRMWEEARKRGQGSGVRGKRKTWWHTSDLFILSRVSSIRRSGSDNGPMMSLDPHYPPLSPGWPSSLLEQG